MDATPVDRVDDFQRRHPVVGLPLGVVYKFFDDQGNYLAATITYYAFIAIFPLLLIASSVLGLLSAGQRRTAAGGARPRRSASSRSSAPSWAPRGAPGQHVGGRRRGARRAVRRARARPGGAERRQRRLGGAAQQPAEPGGQPVPQPRADGPGRRHRAARRDAVQRGQPPQRVRRRRAHRHPVLFVLAVGRAERRGDRRDDAAGHAAARAVARGAARRPRRSR